MAQWTWNGGTADFYTGNNWTESTPTGFSYPQPGDTATIASGLAVISENDVSHAGTLTQLTIDLSAGLSATDEAFGPGVIINNTVFDATATLALSDIALFAGVVEATEPNANIAMTGGADVLNTGAFIDDSLQGTFSVVAGTFENDSIVNVEMGLLTIAAATGITNKGSLIVGGATLGVAGSLQGFGAVDINFGGTAVLGGAGAEQSVDFGLSGGTLVVPGSSFAGVIEDFGTGDVVDLLGVSATADTFAPLQGALALLNNGSVVDRLEFGGDNLSAASFHLQSDGHGGELITGAEVRFWNGASADWYTTADWSTTPGPFVNSFPLAGDTASIASGTAVITAADITAHGTLGNLVIDLGASATIAAAGEVFGPGITLMAAGSDALALTGMSTIAGYIRTLSGGTLTISDDTSLTNTGTILGAGHGAITFITPVLVNDGDINATGSEALSLTQGVVLGTGDFLLGGLNSQNGIYGHATLTVAAGVTVSSTQQVDFLNDKTNELSLNLLHPGDFAAQINGFGRTDTIALNGLVATSTLYNPATGTLDLFAAGAAAPAAILDIGIGFQTGDVTLTTSNGTSFLTTARATGDGSDEALQAPQARAADDVTGAGITVGIISDSFNATGGEAADIASGDLPATVNVLHDENGEDEGRAMAELVHRIAPGATIDFYDDGTGIAAGITALVAAGANIIVDDIASFNQPYFEQGGTYATAAEYAISKGVSYFTSAGNYAPYYYEGTFSALSVTLPGLSGTVLANNFGGGNTLQAITIAAGSSIALSLQWAQPFAGIGNTTGVNDSTLSMYLYNSAMQIVASATLSASDDLPFQNLTYANTGSLTATDRLAIVWTSGTAAPGTFEYIDKDKAAIIDDPNAGTGTGEVIGQEGAPGVNDVGAVDYVDTTAFNNAPTVETYSNDGPGETLINANGQSVAPTSDGEPSFLATDGAATGSLNPFYGTSAAAPDAAAVAALMLSLNVQNGQPLLSPAKVTQLLEESATRISGVSTAAQGYGLINASTAVQLADALDAACYVAGTRIATAAGEIAIERLRIGDPVRTASGLLRPIRWIGERRLDCRRHRQPDRVLPIRVRRHAFAPDLPGRDLLLSPDHGVFIDGVLMPVRVLLNGTSIRREAVDVVEYFHVELDSHDILLAEGLPAESYLDTGNRAAFANGAAFLTLHPDFAPRHWDEACAELVQDGPRAVAAKQRLFARAGRAEAAPPRSLTIFAGPQTLTPTILPDGTWLLALPPRVRALHLVSPATIAAEWHAASLDQRPLGVRVFGIAVDGARLALDAPNLFSGFHLPEQTAEGPCRWTDGDARLVLPPGARMVALRIGDAARWADAA